MGDTISAQKYFKDAIRSAKKQLERNAFERDTRAAHDAAVLQLANAQLFLVYNSVEEILFARQEYEAHLKEILSKSSTLFIPEPATTVGAGALGYYAIYQGFDDRVIRTRLANIYKKSSPHLSFVAPHVAENRDQRFLFESDPHFQLKMQLEQPKTKFNEAAVIVTKRKLQIGFLSSFLFHHSVGLLLENVITK